MFSLIDDDAVDDDAAVDDDTKHDDTVDDNIVGRFEFKKSNLIPFGELRRFC